MSSLKHTFSLLLLILVFSCNSVFGQGFGKNKVQYREFDWHYLQSEHFDVYFYSGGYDIAVFTANIAESSYVSLKNDLRYELTKRVSLIVYKSHNDFQQTNVIDVYLTEGIGGVTELYKNRVVIPYEGSFSQFRHVIHHELVHAVMNDMLYGGSVQSLVSGQVAPVPLWFSEGLAEYLSVRWNTRTDMILRDATISGYLPPINYLNYYLAYQGGNSLFRYIAEKYGNEKISEIIGKIKGSLRFEAAFKSALGIELDELSDNWRKEMRKEYWPDIADRKETKDIARAITDHKEKRNYLNISPALSPNGDKIVFLSDMDGKQSIYLMDIMENKIIKKLIKGQTSVDFEELHWLSPGMSWSPDGNKISFSAKAGDQDALYVYTIAGEKIEQFKFGLDGIFSAAWSPKGDEIAFIGNIDGASDIYVYNVKSKKLENITNDIFSDSDPTWSADGERLAFVSDRSKYISKDLIPEGFNIAHHNFENTDIYIINRDGSGLTRITDTNDRESDPVFSPDGQKLLYVSDRSGIYNMYRHDLTTNESYPITNLLTGAFQLTTDKDGNTLAFSSFSEGGWDLFTIRNPFELPEVSIDKTVFYKKLEKQDLNEILAINPNQKVEADTSERVVKIPRAIDYSNYVFADLERRTTTEIKDVALDEDHYKLEDGHYKVRNYKVKFSPDIVNGAAQYNTLWGFQGYTSIAYSDVLGNHKIYMGTNLVFDLRNSYINAQYWYLPKRIDYGASLFHYSNTYYSSTNGLQRFRNYGLFAIASRPFNKFSRVDFSLYFLNASLEYLEYDIPTETVQSILPGIQLVYDTAEWWYTGPQDGFRGALSLTSSPKYSNESLEFTTVKADLRKYHKITNGYSFALRLYAGASRGSDPQQFYLGGVSNWLNRHYKDGIRINSIRDVYFSEFVTPLRGADFYEKVGNNFALTNVEFRFPLIPFMQLGFPPISLGNIMGVLYTDVGSAWSSDEPYKGVAKDEFGSNRTKDLVVGYGTGARLYFLGLLLKYDLAWRWDLQSSSKPKHYISLGIDF